MTCVIVAYHCNPPTAGIAASGTPADSLITALFSKLAILAMSFFSVLRDSSCFGDLP